MEPKKTEASDISHISDSSQEKSKKQESKKRRSGYVALLGRVNAGKSTLLNACVGSKIAGVSRKPETTVRRVLGVSTSDSTQIIFIDTPGLRASRRATHKRSSFAHHSKVSDYTTRTALAEVEGADLVLYLVDATSMIRHDQISVMHRVIVRCSENTRFQWVLSKCDKLTKSQRQKRLQDFEELCLQMIQDHPEISKHLIVPRPLAISAKVPSDIQRLKAFIGEHLPIGDFHYPSHTITDCTDEQYISEMIREQIFRSTGDEIPYETAVLVSIRKDGEENASRTPVCYVDATIIAGKKSHKGMIIGKNGRQLKKIGTLSRQNIERRLQKKVMLSLWVKVDAGWSRDSQKILVHLS